MLMLLFTSFLYIASTCLNVFISCLFQCRVTEIGLHTSLSFPVNLVVLMPSDGDRTRSTTTHRGRS